MRAPRTIGCLALVALTLGVGLSAASRAESDELQIIVHPGNPMTSIDRDLLRDAFLKKTTSWGHGRAIHPIDLPRTGTRDRFRSIVLRKTQAQLRSYWNQQIFSGKGVPPPEATSTDAAIAYVLNRPGAVGYLPAGTDAGGAKVLRLR